MPNSELVRLFLEQSKSRGGIPLVRKGMRSPTPRGVTRGTLGVLGSRLFRGRNSDASEQRETAILNSPIFQAFVSSFAPRTSVTSYLLRRG